MIEASHLTKIYGAFTAVDDVSFRVDKGEVVGFLGPNGAGKSTTLRILAGFLGASHGKVTIAGHDIADDAIEARRNIGYLPETAPLYPEMRVREYLKFRAELKLVARRSRDEAVDRALADASIEDVAEQAIGHLSKGYRQRVGLADALVASPPLLLLDEPTAGLDPNQIREVRDLIRRLGKERTIFLSTHILSEVESVCTRAIVIARGRLVAEGPIAELRSKTKAVVATVTVRGDRDKIEAALAEAIEGRVVTASFDEGASVGTFEVDLPREDDGSASEKIVAALVEKGFGVRGFVAASSLESVFGELTRDATAPAKEAKPKAKKKSSK